MVLLSKMVATCRGGNVQMAKLFATSFDKADFANTLSDIEDIGMMNWECCWPQLILIKP